MNSNIERCKEIVDGLGFHVANIPNRIAYQTAYQYALDNDAEAKAEEFAWAFATYKLSYMTGAMENKLSIRQAFNAFNS